MEINNIDEPLNLGEAIAQLKVLRIQFENVASVEEQLLLSSQICNLIDFIEIPELIGGIDDHV
tara:strand:+ start:19 stop:207 length:189 start_codon:yes stop_codon:yes gene_type:complete